MDEFGIKIFNKDGTVDWVDPCEEMPEVVDGKVTVSNIVHSYEFENVDRIERYELCAECMHETPNYCICDIDNRG